MELDIEVFSKDFVPLGNLEQRIGARFLQRFNDFGDFDLFAPLTENNTLLLKEENVLWFNKNVAGIIEQIGKTRNLNNDLQYHVSGRTVSSKLEGRVIYPMFSRKEEASKIPCDLVNDFCINPINPKRKIEYLRLSPSNKIFGNVIDYRNTGNDLLEEVKNLCKANNLGFNIVFNPFNKTYDFEILKPLNRTVNQDVNEKIIFDSENDQILTSDYLLNIANWKNTAIVAGEGEGAERIVIEVTRDGKEISGSDRKELWVDARDLQRKNDEGFLMPLEDYKELLKQRGLQKLSEHNFVENFETEIKNFGYQNFIFGKDYFLGDYVTVLDRDLKVVVDKQITEIEETYDENGYTPRITFGELQPSLKEIIKRRG